MWVDGEHGAGGTRTSTSSDVAIIEHEHEHPPTALAHPAHPAHHCPTLPAPCLPHIDQINFQNSPKPHIGNKYVTVNNAIHVDEVVQGRCLGLQITSPVRARRVRCGIAVFVGWALVLALGLFIYFFCVVVTTKHRMDIDVSCWRYLWSLAKNSSRAERLACAAAVVVLALCIALVVYFIVFHAKAPLEPPDIAPAELDWYIRRDEWLAKPYNNTEIEGRFDPLRVVVVQHTVGNQCARFAKCAAEMRNLQDYFFSKHYDIAYNFQVGNDGRVYEGRGWHKVGAHTKGYNMCSVGIGFLGDYRERGAQVTALQEARVHRLLQLGVELGLLHPQYRVVGARDVGPTASPGYNLYEAMQKWPHYDHKHLFTNKTCDQINDMPFP